MKYLIIVGLFPAAAWANALLPLNNIWNNETPKWFFIAYFLILVIETLMFKLFSKQIKLWIHFKAVLIANLLSSLVGSLIINWIDEQPYFNESYSKIFTVFFIITVLTEYPVFRYIYSKYFLKNLFAKTISANFLTYILLFVLQLLGFFVSLKLIEVKADEYKEEWTHREIVPKDLNVIYEKRVNRGSESHLALYSLESVQHINEQSKNNVQALSKEYILASNKDFEANGELLNWKTKKRIINEINVYKSQIFHSKDLGLILFRERSGLEGIVGANGWRSMYGSSYDLEFLTQKVNMRLKNVRYGGIYKFGKDIIYSTHDECIADEVEVPKSNKVERCSKDPSTHIALMRADGSSKYLARNSRNPTLRKTNLYFLNKKQQIEKLDLIKEEKDIVFEEAISDFKVTPDERYFIVKTENMFPMGRRYFLVIVERSSNKRYIIDDGQINDFDIMD